MRIRSVQLAGSRATPRALGKLGERAGLTLLEVSIALAVIVTIMLGSAAGFGGSLKGVETAKRTSQAAVFLETVMEDLAAQPYDNLLAFNGNQIFDGGAAVSSQFAVTLTVVPVAIDLVQVHVVLTDLRTNRTIGKLATQRSRR
jgi:prepilin-type N-terminal cleavage/methylation domain-containing protein